MPLELSDELKRSPFEEVDDLVIGISKDEFKNSIHGFQRVLDVLEGYKGCKNASKLELVYSLEMSKNILNQSLYHRIDEIDTILDGRSRGFVPFTPNEGYGSCDIECDEEYLEELNKERVRIEAYLKNIENIQSMLSPKE